MGRLKAQFSPAFARDVKRLRKKHVWTSNDEIALMERTGSHDELFR